MPKQAKRRFVGLNTEEVSLVETPANEVEFLVVKHQENRNMGATATVKRDAVRVPVELEGGDDDAVSKALAHVNGIVDKIAGMVNTKKEAKAPADDGDEVTSEGDDDVTEDGDDSDGADETETTKAASIKSVLEKCGMDAAMVKTAVVKLKAAGISGVVPPSKKPPINKRPKGKDDEDDDEDDDDDDKKKKPPFGKKTVKADEPLTMSSLASAVQKAAAFTPQRIKALQDAQDILKVVLEAVTPGTSPDTNTPALGKHPNASGVAELLGAHKKPTVPTFKSADGEEIVTTMKSLADAVGNLLTRVESIETKRSASNSVEPDGGTETGTKKSGSMWSGVL